MRTPLLILALLVTGCGDISPAGVASAPQEAHETFVEGPRLKRLYEEFLKEAQAQGAPVGRVPHSIRWAEGMVDGHLGECYGAIGTVRISDMLSVYDDYQVRTVLWHELGHCMYGLGHSATGIMSATSDNGDYTGDWQANVDELFTQIRGY